jgi:hypothetical protein
MTGIEEHVAEGGIGAMIVYFFIKELMSRKKNTSDRAEYISHRAEDKAEDILTAVKHDNICDRRIGSLEKLFDTKLDNVEKVAIRTLEIVEDMNGNKHKRHGDGDG